MQLKNYYRRAILYLALVVGTISIIHFQVTRSWSVTKWSYQADAFLLSFNIRCDAGVPAGLESILKHISLPYFSLTGQAVYLDAKGASYRCSVSPSPYPKDERSFRLASTTKALTALALLKLFQNESIALNTPLLEFFPEVDHGNLRDQNVALVTLNHLLNHSSGFGGPFGSDNMVKKGEKPWCPYDFKNLEKVRLAGMPGTNHLYSNVAYCLLGEVITRITGQDYREYIREHYLVGYESLDFVTAEFLPEEPEYDFTHAYRLGSDYVNWLDFHAISSSAGLIGKPTEFAHLIWTLNQRDPGLIFNGPQVEQCESKNLGNCYSYTFVLEGGSDQETTVAIQQGYMPGVSSLLAISTSGEVVVWVAAGAAARDEYKQRMVREVVDLLSTSQASQ